MRKAIFLFVALLCTTSFFASAQKTEPDDIDLKFNTGGDTLIIHILDKNVKEFDLFIYASSEEVKVDAHPKENPVHIPIANWRRGIYHIKIDYGFITQFRNIEIFE